jgi:hypothetical protein
VIESREEGEKEAILPKSPKSENSKDSGKSNKI